MTTAIAYASATVSVVTPAADHSAPEPANRSIADHTAAGAGKNSGLSTCALVIAIQPATNRRTAPP